MKAFSFVYLVYIVPLSILFPLVTAMLRASARRHPLWILVTYLVVSGSINLVALIYSSSNNLPFLHAYTMAEGTLLLLFYRFVQPVQWLRKVNAVLVLVFPLMCIVNLLFFQSIFQFNSYVRPVEAILLIGNCILYFWNETERGESGVWASGPLNWINAGILLYFSGSLFQFIFSNVISATASFNIKLLILDIHGTLVLMMYILMGIGFNKCKS